MELEEKLSQNYFKTGIWSSEKKMDFEEEILLYYVLINVYAVGLD